MCTVLQFQDVHVLVRTAEQQERLFRKRELECKGCVWGQAVKRLVRVLRSSWCPQGQNVTLWMRRKETTSYICDSPKYQSLLPPNATSSSAEWEKSESWAGQWLVGESFAGLLLQRMWFVTKSQESFVFKSWNRSLTTCIDGITHITLWEWLHLCNLSYETKCSDLVNPSCDLFLKLTN